MNCTPRTFKGEPGQGAWRHAENHIQRALLCSHLFLICTCPCSKFKHLVADYSLGVCFPPNWKPVCFYSLPFTPPVLVARLCPTLCNSEDCSPPGSSVPGMSQARILKWVSIPFSRGSPPTQGSNPGLLHCRHIPYHLNHQGSLYFIYHLSHVGSLYTKETIYCITINFVFERYPAYIYTMYISVIICNKLSIIPYFIQQLNWQNLAWKVECKAHRSKFCSPSLKRKVHLHHKIAH